MRRMAALWVVLGGLWSCQTSEYPAPVLGSTYRIEEDRKDEQSEMIIDILTTDYECANAQIDELEWADGFKKTQQILRYSRVDSHDKVDDVYVAYVKVIGDVVVFALENEAAAKLNGPGESQISRVSESGYGSRLGGQLTFLVANRLLSP